MDDPLSFLVGLPNLLLFGFDITDFRGVGVIDHGVDFVSNGLLIGTSLAQRFVDGLLHQDELLNLRRVFFDLGSTLNSPAEGDAHLSL